MRLNKKGFVVSTLMYTILIVFLFLIVGIITLLANRKMILDKLKKDVKDEINEMSKYDYYDETTVIYYNPVTGKICGNYTEDNSTSNAKTGCLKWYVFDDSNNSNKIKLILDHNTSYSVSKSNINSELDKLSTESNWVNKPRLIKADEVASITENTDFDSDSAGSWYYLENNSQTEPALKTNFSYTGNQQTYTASSDGLYNIKAWGASGGEGKFNGNAGTELGGAGAYTAGTIELKNNESLYVYVGGEGKTATSSTQHTTLAGGFNGGGNGVSGGTDDQAGSGGGATDIRVTSGTWNNAASLASRIMVAAGGGGGHCHKSGAYGNNRTFFPLINGQKLSYSGTLGQWSDGTYSVAASQTSGNAFGVGGSFANLEGTHGAGGGGGGYWGGIANTNKAGGPGSGGTSYISGYLGCVAITSASSTSPKSGCANGTNDINCSYHYSNKKFINPVMIAGNTSMPTHDGESSVTGNSGNGYASITRVSDNAWLYDYTNNCESYGCIKNNNSTYGYWTSTGLWVVDSSGRISSAKDTSTEFGIRPVIEIFKPNADKSEDVTEFAYTGKQQQFIVPKTGYYKIELWGAQGGTSGSYFGGSGSYTSGNIKLEKDEKLYIYVGGQGGQNATITNTGGYNGGGYSGNNGGAQSYGGGGATDIRVTSGTWNNAASLASRIMVAAGGGGGTAGTATTAGAGGALTGLSGTSANSTFNTATYLPLGGSQIAGGFGYQNSTARNGQWGMGVQTNSGGWGGGGGAGYYGGGNGHGTTGAGGSSFISGYAGVNAITSASSTTPTNNTKHYSGKYFIDGVMNPAINNGNGKAKITYLGNSTKKKSFDESYQRLEYIQSTGTQYIDTGYKATPSTGVEIDYQFTEVHTLQQRLFVASTTNTNYLNYQMYINGAGKWAYAFIDGSGNWISTEVVADTKKHNIKFNIPNNQYQLDNNIYNIVSSTRTKYAETNMYVMGGIGAVGASMKLYSFKIYNGNRILVRDMIPVKRKSDNAIGLYDKVENKFYANAGTGTFTAGPVIDLNNVRYIKDCTSGSSVNASNHWVELQAIKDGVNIAKGKTATGITNNTNFPISRITDGDLTSANYAEGGSASPVCITIDLGSTYNLDEIAVWHYWADERTYNNHNLNVSSDNSTWKTVISSTEKETSQGKRVSAWN